VSFGAGALSLDTTGEHAADLAEVGRMLRGGAIYLRTCETARVGAAQRSSKRWRASAERQSQLRRSASVQRRAAGSGNSTHA
jgi:hypothetical protein